MTIIIPIKKKDRKLLHAMAGTFLHGQCYAFALAVHAGTGWDLCGLMNGDIIQHVGVRDLKGRFFDARGFVEESDIVVPFSREFDTTCKFKKVAPEDLHAAKEMPKEVLSQARRWAELLFPELPWPDTERQYIADFLLELENLCKARGFYICSKIPDVPISIYRMDGDEKGFEMQMCIAGGAFFNRTYEGEDDEKPKG